MVAAVKLLNITKKKKSRKVREETFFTKKKKRTLYKTVACTCVLV